MGRPYKCPYCSSTKTAWKGYRRRQDGKARLRKCKSCGRRFTTRVVLESEARAENQRGVENHDGNRDETG